MLAGVSWTRPGLPVAHAVDTSTSAAAVTADSTTGASAVAENVTVAAVAASPAVGTIGAGDTVAGCT